MKNYKIFFLASLLMFVGYVFCVLQLDSASEVTTTNWNIFKPHFLVFIFTFLLAGVLDFVNYYLNSKRNVILAKIHIIVTFLSMGIVSFLSFLLQNIFVPNRYYSFDESKSIDFYGQINILITIVAIIFFLGQLIPIFDLIRSKINK